MSGMWLVIIAVCLWALWTALRSTWQERREIRREVQQEYRRFMLWEYFRDREERRKDR